MKPTAETHRWIQVEAIFHQVIEAPKEDRESLVSRLAGSDMVLRNEVLSLLHAFENADHFLEDSEGLGTNLTEVLSRWQQRSTVDNHAGTPSLAKSGAIHEKNAILKHVLTPMTVDGVREFFAKHRPELQILELAGEGAAGIVVKARDTKLDRLIAIKILRPAWANRLGEAALTREATAASLSSDNVVRVYEVSPNDSSCLYILMEWIEGPSLREYLAQSLDFNPLDAARMALQIAVGIAASQRRGIVHGDIKPANVMLEPLAVSSSFLSNAETGKRPEFGLKGLVDQVDLKSYRAKLTDFGLARRTQASPAKPITTVGPDYETSQGGFVGTPAYASPEQLLHGHPASNLSDVWALGATLYHLLCGVPPHTGRPHAIARQMQLGPPVPPRQIDPRIPRDLESICMKALSREPSQRYLTAQHLADDLQRFLDGVPVLARPVRWPGRMLRMVQRHPLAASLMSCLFLALLSGALVSNHFRLRAENNLEVAVRNSQAARDERDNALAVIKLLKTMVSSSDTHFGSPDVRMIDVLRSVEAKLGAELNGKPSIEAEVRSSLGTMFFSIAAYDAAYEQFRKAIDLRGPQSLTIAQLHDKIELANTLRWLYRPEEALDHALQANALAEDNFGEGHAIAQNSTEVLAGCYQDLGKLDEAAALFQRVITIDASGDRSLTARSGLASVLIDQRKNAEAEALLLASISRRKELGLFDTRESLVLESNLGAALSEQGKIDEAIEVQRSCAERSSRLLGRTHDATLTAWQNYADTLRRHGEHERAMEINRDLWQLCRGELGFEHPQTLKIAESVVLNLVRQREFSEALQVADEILQKGVPDLPSNEDWHQTFLATRCAALTGLGRADETIPIYEQIIQYFGTKLGSQSTQVLVHRNNFGLALIEAGQYQRAASLYRELVAQVAGNEMASVERNIKRNLGLALLRSGEMEAASELLKSIYRESTAAGELENAAKCKEYLELVDEDRKKRQ